MPARPKPVAPAVYRPQPTPKVLQRKTAPRQQPHGAGPKRPPAAPPVYRPQPVPKVLQRKATAQPRLSPSTQPNRLPVAPPAYRPQPVPRVLQRKVAQGRPLPVGEKINPAARVIQRLVLRLGEDKAVNASAERLEQKLDKQGQIKPGHEPMPKDTGLANLGKQEKLHIVGHGTQVENDSGLVTHVTHLGDYNPEELADYLIKLGLREDYQGQIVLQSCNTGTGDENNYAVMFQQALSKRKRNVSVKAMKGRTKITREGKAVVASHEQYQEFMKQAKVVESESDLRLKNLKHWNQKSSEFIQHYHSISDPSEKAEYLARLEELNEKLKDRKAQTNDELQALADEAKKLKQKYYTPAKENKLTLDPIT